MSQVKFPFYARLALILLAVVLILFILMVGKDIFIPVVFAFLISMLLLPLMKFFEGKLRLGKSMSAFLSIFIFLTFMGGLFYFLTVQFAGFSGNFPLIEKKLTSIIQNFQYWLATKYHINTSQQTDYFNKSASGIITTIANSISGIFLSFTKIVLWLVFIFIYTFFMLCNREQLIKFILHLFSVQHRAKVNEVLIETRGVINSYVIGLLIEMMLVGIMNCTAFAIIGVQYALLLGIMAAVLNLIPYLGIFSSMAFIMLVTFANSSGSLALETGITLVCVHLIDSNILMPRIVGRRVRINPFITIIVVLIGNFLWGIPGMFLFIPITGILKLVCERVDGLEAWAILIGIQEKEKRVKKK